MPKTTIVITSINAPNEALRQFAEGAACHGMHLTVVGDTKSPGDFALEGCEFLSLDEQLASGLRFARACPTRHYARKNIGYLVNIARGTEVIVDTDDDNLPYDTFWAERQREVPSAIVQTPGWLNVYRYFTDALIWPRGLPLDAVQCVAPPFEDLPETVVMAPIQQGLANDNPDVDALYRLILPLPMQFRNDRVVALGKEVWCPFNSQNTTWFEEAFPLLYLPAYCSFRMTDIWRSFVAQRIAWENDWPLVFHGPTVWQERNDHQLMRDFADEIPGYLNNRRMAEVLESLPLKGGQDHLGENLRVCYEALVREQWVGAEELNLLDCWLADLTQVCGTKV